MTRKLYAVYDRKAECLIGPVIAEAADAAAARTFIDALKDVNALGRHAEDYDLLCLGTLDEKGRIEQTANLATILSGELWTLSNNHNKEATPNG